MLVSLGLIGEFKMKRCKECERPLPTPFSSFAADIFFSFALGFIAQLCANQLGGKYFHWPVLTYWDVFSGVFLTRITFRALRGEV